MKITLPEGKGIILSQIFIVLFVFFIPISPTAKSISFFGALLVLFFTPYFNQHIINNYKSLLGLSAGALFIFILISCIWSPASFSSQLSVVSKYSKLIYLPIIAVGFINSKSRIWSLNAYLLAIILTCIISFLKFKGFVINADPGEVFYNHIITGFMVAFASYVAALLALEARGWLRVFYVCTTLITSYQILFINTGRTGYIVFIILMVLLLINKLSVRASIMGMLLFSIAFVLVYHQSETMQTGVKHLISDVNSLKNDNKNTSLGFRIQFHQYAKSLFFKHPIIGIGAGGFSYRFYQDNPVPAWGREITDPHSQYWMTLSEQGLIGFCLLVFFLMSICITSLTLNKTKPLLLGILVSFGVVSLTDTILCYSTAGYLLIVMCALCCGELLEQRIQLIRPDMTKQNILDVKAA